MIKLSILIPSLFNRLKVRNRLLELLNKQPPELLDQCEILIEIDRGQTSIGQKRNNLVHSSKGEYIIFIDDDDIITSDYLIRIFQGLNMGVDHVGVGMMYVPKEGVSKPVECSVKNDWTETPEKYLRPPEHICAVKREIALQAPFPDVYFGEDKHYALQLKKLVKTEYVIKDPIYYYLYIEKSRNHAKNN